MQILFNIRLMRVLVGMFILAFWLPAVVYAVTPEPKSGGKFFQSKGTKAEETYEEQGRAGTPGYEYGKGFQVWQILLKPLVQYAHRWENNIFLEENGRKEDHINNLVAGLNGELPLVGGQHLLTGGYEADIEWFERYDDQDHTDHKINGGLELNFVPFSLNVQEEYKRTVSRADTEFTDRVSRDENTLNGLLEVPFAAFFLETEVNDYDVDYRDETNSVFDHHEFRIYQRAGVDVSPNTQGLVEYGFTDIHYNKVDDRDGQANQVMLGLRGFFTERISYQLWGGAQWRIYEEDTRPDFNGFVMRGAMLYEISELSSITLKGDRTPIESTFDDQSFYVRNKGSLVWRQQIAERLFLNTDGSVSYNEYSRITVRNNTEKTRRDYVWGAGVGLEYLMPNDIVSFFGEYRYAARDSNTALLDYDNQIVNVGVKAKF